MIGTKGFLVTFYGDDSVGIQSQTWEIKGDFEFIDESDLKIFKHKIAGAFEYCSDTPIDVITFEENDKRIKMYDKVYP